MTTALAWQVQLAMAGALADAHETQLPARAGVVVEPAHRGHVIAPGLKAVASVQLGQGTASGPNVVAPAQADLTWVVTEPARKRVLLPGEERSIREALAAEDLAQAEDELIATTAAAATAAPLATVYFPFNSSRPIGLNLLADFAHGLPAQQGLHVIGHTDAMGSDAYNLSLSLRRANSVAAFLGRNGVPKNRLEISGKGESELANQSDPAKNRRVEILAEEKGGK